MATGLGDAMNDPKTAENCRPFVWNRKRTEAAVLVAQDEFTNREIAEAVGMSERQLQNWKQHPEFQARVMESARALGDAAERYAIARKLRRVKRLNDDWHRMQQVVAERAADPTMQNVPGGQTGLLVRDVESVGARDNPQVVEVFTVDTGLLRELRATERQAAQELHMWIEKADVTSDGQAIEFICLPGVTPDDAKPADETRDDKPGLNGQR